MVFFRKICLGTLILMASPIFALSDIAQKFSNLSKEEKLLVIKDFYAHYQATLKSTNDKNSQFAKILTEQAAKVTDAMSSNRRATVELPDFKLIGGYIGNKFQGDYIALQPRTTYMVDFWEKEVHFDAKIKQTFNSEKKDILYLAYDKLSGYVKITEPIRKKSIFVKKIDITYDEILNALKILN